MGVAERKEREKEQRRKGILDAAEKVFFKHGVENATMDNVAEEAELSKATSVGSPLAPSSSIKTLLHRRPILNKTGRFASFFSNPFSVILIILKLVKIFLTNISPLVRVPVLSAHMKVVDPKVSAEASLLIRDLRFASSLAPNARLITTKAGIPSGTADTANATAIIKVLIKVFDSVPNLMTLRMNITAHIPIISKPTFFAKESNFISRGGKSILKSAVYVIRYAYLRNRFNELLE